MNDVIEKARALMNVLPDDVNDYPDCSLFRMVQDRIARLDEAIVDYEKQEKEEVEFIKSQIDKNI
jgi:hypothetical protein